MTAIMTMPKQELIAFLAFNVVVAALTLLAFIAIMRMDIEG